jgi:hypothetical protein
MAMWLGAVPAPPDDQVQPGWLGFFVVLALGIVTYLLWRSMNTHLKRVNFEEPPADRKEDGTDNRGAASGSSGDRDPAVDDGAGDAGDERPGSTKRHDL